jgi:hypothetical protein
LVAGIVAFVLGAFVSGAAMVLVVAMLLVAGALVSMLGAAAALVSVMVVGGVEVSEPVPVSELLLQPIRVRGRARATAASKVDWIRGRFITLLYAAVRLGIKP